jgi:hypothetical protein
MMLRNFSDHILIENYCMTLSLLFTAYTCKHDFSVMQTLILFTLLKRSRSLLSSFTYTKPWNRYLMNFSQSSFRSLTTLALLDESGLDCSDEQWQMFIIKCFSVNLWLFTSITLDYILKVIPNLEEFRLSMLNVFHDSADDSYEMQVPKTFKKLHLEFKYEYQLGFEV